METSQKDLEQSTSVAMCTYNGVRYLSRQLDSIAAQTKKPDELVICDDGSNDGTIELIQRFLPLAPFPVRLFQNPVQLGPAHNFAQAMQHCRGDIIFLCDQDDVWIPDKVSVMLRTFAEHPKALYAFSDAKIIDQQGTVLPKTLWREVGFDPQQTDFAGARQIKLLLQRNVVTGAAMALRATFRAVALPIAPGWMHDYWLAQLGSILAYGVAITEPLLWYRSHDTQACGVNKRSFLDEYKISKETKEESNWTKLERFRTIKNRVQANLPTDAKVDPRLQLIDQKELHLENRALARSTRGPLRYKKIIGELLSGRYARFSESWLSVLRDLSI